MAFVANATGTGKLVHNELETDDLRVRRTRKLLQRALMELTVEKGFAAITVSDLTERAMVNRSTFYRHYLDKYDLLEQYLTEVYSIVAADSHVPQNGGVPAAQPPPGVVNLLKYIQAHAAFFRVMFGAKGDPAFVQQFRKNTEKRFRYLMQTVGVAPKPGGPPVDLRLSYVSYAGIGAISWWLENDQPCTVEQLALWLGQLSSASTGLSSGTPLPTASTPTRKHA